MVTLCMWHGLCLVHNSGRVAILKHANASAGKCMNILTEIKSITSFMSFQVSSFCQMCWDQVGLMAMK